MEIESRSEHNPPTTKLRIVNGMDEDFEEALRSLDNQDSFDDQTESEDQFPEDDPTQPPSPPPERPILPLIVLIIPPAGSVISKTSLDPVEILEFITEHIEKAILLDEVFLWKVFVFRGEPVSLVGDVLAGELGLKIDGRIVTLPSVLDAASELPAGELSHLYTTGIKHHDSDQATDSEAEDEDDFSNLF